MRLELVLTPAEVAGDAGAEVVAQGQEHLVAFGLQPGAPGLAGQHGPQRAEALGRGDADAPCLPPERGELFVAAWVVLASRDDGLALVGNEGGLAPSPGGLSHDPGDPRE